MAKRINMFLFPCSVVQTHEFCPISCLLPCLFVCLHPSTHDLSLNMSLLVTQSTHGPHFYRRMHLLSCFNYHQVCVYWDQLHANCLVLFYYTFFTLHVSDVIYIHPQERLIMHMQMIQASARVS